jgi:hypothetical protein
MCDPATRSELDISAARYVLGQIPSSELVRLADKMLNHGVFSEGFANLWNLSDITMSEVAPLFEAALRELGVSRPSRAEAQRLLVAEILTQIVSKRVEPTKGLLDFMHCVACISRSEAYDDRALCAAMGLMGLVEAYWSYDELEDLRIMREISPQHYDDKLRRLEQLILEVAQRWLTSTTQSQTD